MIVQEFNEMYGRELDTSFVTRRLQDVSYGPFERNVLDVYYPESKDVRRDPLPVLVFFHGGGFFKGDKRRYQLAPALQALSLGYAVVSVNYRLIDTAALPAQVHDAKAAIRYLRAHCDELGLDAERMAAFGESAGATLACALGLTDGDAYYEDPSLGNPDVSAGVRAVVDWYGPLDLSVMLAEEAAGPGPTLRYGGMGVTEAAFNLGSELSFDEVASAAARFDLVRGRQPKDGYSAFYILHGTEDELVSVRQSKDLHAFLSQRLQNDALVLSLVPGGRHGVGEYVSEDVLGPLFDWLGRQLDLG